MRDMKRRKPHGTHPHQRLTAVSVRTKKTPGRYADGQGLYLVVDPTGAKRWIWRGRIQGRRADLGLGGVPRVTLIDARAQALACKRTARTGGDPRIARQQERRVVPTFKTAATQVHAEHSPTFRNPKHAAQWLASLDNDIFPIIGSQPIDSLDTSDVLRVLTPIWTVKPETARRLKQRMKLVFDWAKAKGFRSGDNPTDGITKVLPKHRDDKQHHPALPYADIHAFVTALGKLTDISDAVRGALELLILTASRTSEVRLARWSEIDVESRTWTIPGERTKNGRDHRVPLSTRALDLLHQAHAHRRVGDDWIFPGTKPSQPLSDMTLLKAGRRLTTATITTHGFRSSFRDWSAERTNIPRDVCEAALAHTLKDKTEAAYKRTDLFDKRRALMDLWATFVATPPVDSNANHA